MAAFIYERAALLSALKLVAPAIAKPKAAAVASLFENVWFTDWGVLASNDVIAMAAPLDAGVEGGVHGGRLIGLLSNCDSEVVKLSNGGNGLQLQGGFEATLAVDRGEPPFVWPQGDEEGEPITVDDDFASAAKLGMKVANPGSQSPQATGITLTRDDGGLLLYASDRSSLLKVSFEQAGPILQSILTLDFVAEMVKLAPGRLWLQDDYALFDSAAAGLWGRTIRDDKPLDYEGTLHLRRPPQMAALPDGFRQAMLRAGLMAAHDAAKLPVGLAVRNNEMHIGASGPGGVLNDVLPFAHPNITVSFDQRLVQRIGASGFTHLGVGPRGLLFRAEDGYEYLIATQD